MSFDRDTLLQHLDQRVRRNCRFIGREVEQLERVTRVNGPTPAAIDNVIMWSRLDEDNADAEIATHKEWFAAKKHNFEWIVYEHDKPSDLGERMMRSGAVVESKEEVLIASAEEISTSTGDSKYEMRCVTDPADLGDLSEVQEEVWGPQDIGFVRRWLTNLLNDHPKETCICVAYDGSKPVAAAWTLMWDDRSFAPFFGGSVIPEYRGRGIYKAMVKFRAEVVAERGIPWCLVDAGPESCPILLRNGFERLTARTSYRFDV